ncbi:hypothetical protein SBA4_3050002 [Candidatus Sulfopaludibacter sp. SbA4]|nr:hypothetical protein SBA4_3050002 [Candidatus Sulfopaludibacter sp. SbA4]
MVGVRGREAQILRLCQFYFRGCLRPAVSVGCGRLWKSGGAKSGVFLQFAPPGRGNGVVTHVTQKIGDVALLFARV